MGTVMKALGGLWAEHKAAAAAATAAAGMAQGGNPAATPKGRPTAGHTRTAGTAGAATAGPASPASRPPPPPQVPPTAALAAGTGAQAGRAGPSQASPGSGVQVRSMGGSRRPAGVQVGSRASGSGSSVASVSGGGSVGNRDEAVTPLSTVAGGSWSHAGEAGLVPRRLSAELEELRVASPAAARQALTSDGGSPVATALAAENRAHPARVPGSHWQHVRQSASQAGTRHAAAAAGSSSPSSDEEDLQSFLAAGVRSMDIRHG